MKKIVFSLVLTLFAAFMNAQESQTSYNFLRLPVSAHAAALGGDNITLIEDDEALVFHNPALLSSVSDKTINLNYMNYMSGVNVASASFNRIVKEKASWAVSAQYIDYGKMKQTEENNIEMGEFSAKDIALAGHFSYMLARNLAGGISARFITSYIGDYNSITMGVDLGLNYYDPEQDLSISAVAKNLGGQLKAYDEEYEKMPIDLQVGAELLLGESLWLGAGYNARRADEMTISTGEENEESSHGAGWSFGGGINLERFQLNVAYGKYHVSSNSLVLSVNYKL